MTTVAPCPNKSAQQAPGIALIHPAGDDNIPKEEDCCPKN